MHIVVDHGVRKVSLCSVLS